MQRCTGPATTGAWWAKSGPVWPTSTDVVFVGDPTWDRFEAAGAAVTDAHVEAAAAALAFDDPINIQYTSGTTGFPKGATLSHHNILNNGYFVAELLGYGEADRVCLPVPFYHCFGMVMGNLGSTTHGSTIVIPAPLFDPAATLAAIEQERCTSLYGVPTMFIAELGVEGFAGYDLTSLRTGLMAGSPVPGGDHEAGAERDAHDRSGHCLRYDRDISGLDPDPGR